VVGFVQVTLAVNDSPAALLRDLREALRSKSVSRIRADFQNPSGANYLFSMASNRGESDRAQSQSARIEIGLGKIKIAMIPAPPGWPGHYWAIFHTAQTIEEDHDPVYKVVQDQKGSWALADEIPEDSLGGWRITSQKYRAVLSPSVSRVTVQVEVSLAKGTGIAVPFRLNDTYKLSGDVVMAGEVEIPSVREGQILRAGSLLIPWTRALGSKLDLNYSAILPRGPEDEITPNDAYVTAWWLPSLGRLPFPVNATITAPNAWKVRAEGIQISSRRIGAEQVVGFTCDLPISYPKIVAGKYKEMASQQVDGAKFAIYQVSPTDSRRAKRDLKNMLAAAKFYKERLGPLPFKGYECYDATRYYGIESYSHTLLQRDVTHFISHEMGHSYFGGLAPCPYVNDSWNEGVTEYVDSVLLLHDADKSLENGLGTVDIPVPLAKMPIPWNLDDATYWRGCYVMKMLESEIGLDAVLEALKLITTERVGQDTRWTDLRAYFERTSHRALDWFWRQWIEGAAFPTLHYTAETSRDAKGQFETVIKVDQEGISTPFQIRAAVKLAGAEDTHDRPIQLTDRSSTLRFTTTRNPNHVELVIFPYTLARLKRS
jgi:hypothetical protein